MHKNKTFFYTLIVVMILSVFALPAAVMAQDEAAAGEEAPEPPKPFKPGFFSMDHNFWGMFEQIEPLLLNFILPVVFLSTLIKVWLLKRKLKFPWQQLEKVSLTTMAESIVEVLIIIMTVFFFKPAFSQILDFLGYTPAADWTSEALTYALHTVMSIPYHCIIGALLVLVLLNFLVPVKLEERKKDVWYAAYIATITPLTLAVYLFVSRFIFKWYLY